VDTPPIAGASVAADRARGPSPPRNHGRTRDALAGGAPTGRTPFPYLMPPHAETEKLPQAYDAAYRRDIDGFAIENNLARS
jgi:hypothetical protein